MVVFIYHVWWYIYIYIELYYMIFEYPPKIPSSKLLDMLWLHCINICILFQEDKPWTWFQLITLLLITLFGFSSLRICCQSVSVDSWALAISFWINRSWLIYANIIANIIWRFSKMGVDPVIIHFNRIFPDQPSSYWGSTIYGNPHNESGISLWITINHN